jgi:hypothetical protein
MRRGKSDKHKQVVGSFPRGKVKSESVREEKVRKTSPPTPRKANFPAFF